MSDQILILDFGSQYTQLIARRIRELNVYCEVHPFHNCPPITPNIKGIILSGGPCSVQHEGSPNVDISLFQSIPLLGICYGAQLLVQYGGGEVTPSRMSEYGKANLTLSNSSHQLVQGITTNSQVWMSHTDAISFLPTGYEILARTESAEVAAFYSVREKQYGFLFHPEVTHTVEGGTWIRNFVVDVCGCAQDWTPDHFVDMTVARLSELLGQEKVLMALSGGVDSTVAAALIHKAIGKNLYCIFVDNGLLRKGEFEQVINVYKKMELNVKGVDAGEQFYNALRGLTNPEAKRKAIGKTFTDVFEKESELLPGTFWLGQGTIYPDVIESVPLKGPSTTIKSHHNVGGLPKDMTMKVVEPLNTLFKDEVRRVGQALDIDSTILARHPFPGPGLGIRIVGEVTVEKVRILQEADHIFMRSLHEYGLYDEVWQAGTILLPVKSVGVMGDERTYENTVVLRAVTSIDGMTADWARLPHDFLSTVSSSIISTVKGVNRVVYDISSKPPATIEWE